MRVISRLTDYTTLVVPGVKITLPSVMLDLALTKDRGFYVVTELSTGSRIGIEMATKKDAIESAIAELNKYGQLTTMLVTSRLQTKLGIANVNTSDTP